MARLLLQLLFLHNCVYNPHVWNLRWNMFKNRENLVSISYMNEKDSKMQKTSEEVVYTPCSSAPVKCDLVTSLGDNFSVITSPVANCAFSANRLKNLLNWSYKDFIPDDFWRIAALYWIRVFSSGSRFLRLVQQLDSWDLHCKYRHGYVISGFSKHPYKLN